jgi:hypothetical protein
MATSGSVDYSETTNGIIKAALRRIGAVGIGYEPTADDYDYCVGELNRLMKASAKMGWNVFRSEEGSLTLVSGQAEYTFGGSGSPDVAYRPLRFEEIRWRNSDGTDLPMTERAREDYFTQPDKTTQGTPTTWYYHPERDSGKLYIWPVPNATTATTLQYTYQRTLEDFDSTAGNPDIPQEWYDVLVKGLAYNIATAYFPERPDIKQMASADYQSSLQSALDYDHETASIYFTAEAGRYG